MHGEKISCVISGEKIEDAMIVLNNEQYYILQDTIEGYKVEDRSLMGNYKFSWNVGHGEWEDIEINSVTDITFKDSLAYSIY